MKLADGVWIIGLHDGAVTIPESALAPDSYIPNLVLTSLTIGDKPVRYAVNDIHRLELQKDERSLTLTFAALDYRGSKDIQYAYRMEGDSAWHYLGTNNTVALPDSHRAGSSCNSDAPMPKAVGALFCERSR